VNGVPYWSTAENGPILNPTVSITRINKTFYWPREWHLTAIQPGLIFGWIIPCALILGAFIWFSEKLHNGRPKAAGNLE
jgi:hypothetical protein